MGQRHHCICEYWNDAPFAGNLHWNLSKDSVLFHAGTGTLRKFLRHPKSVDTSVLAVSLPERQCQLCNRPGRPSIALHATSQHWRSISPVEPPSSHMEIEALRISRQTLNPPPYNLEGIRRNLEKPLSAIPDKNRQKSIDIRRENRERA